jgi:hypothetical protein
MTNQHADLSQTLAEQRISERHDQAAHARLARSARPPRRKRWASRGWWQLTWRPAIATEQPVHRPQRVS